MSAIQMTCPDCGETYLAGVVGSTAWPPHECSVRKQRDEAQARISQLEEALRQIARTPIMDDLSGYDGPPDPRGHLRKLARAALADPEEEG